MKISYLIMEFGKTGGSIVLYNFMDELVKRGHEVYAITPDLQLKWKPGIWKDNFSEVQNKNIITKKIEAIYDLIKTNVMQYFNDQYHPYDLKKTTKNLIKNWKESDITISTYFLTAYAGYLLSDKTIPLYHMQGFEEAFFQNKDLRLIARTSYYLPLIKLSNSKWLKGIISKYFNKESYLLNPGIDLEIFKPYKNIKNKYKKKQKWTVVSYFNDTWDLKGAFDAYRAIKIARKYFKDKGIELEWKVFGFTPPTKNYDTEIEYVGSKFGEDLAKLYSQSDIVLLTSWYESFPLPPIEAMACGSLIITTRYGTEDYVFNGENGLVCLPRDIDDMVKKIIYAIENPKESLIMVQNGLETASNYTWDKRTDELEYLLNKAVKNYSFDKFKLFDDLVDGNFKDYMYKEFEFE